MSGQRLVIYVAIMACVTYAIRALPLLLLRNPIRSRFIQSFLTYIPYAVLGAMTIPAIFTSTASVLSALVGLVVAVVLAWRGRGLLTVALAACAAVFITQQLMGLL